MITFGDAPLLHHDERENDRQETVTRTVLVSPAKYRVHVLARVSNGYQKIEQETTNNENMILHDHHRLFNYGLAITTGEYLSDK